MQLSPPSVACDAETTPEPPPLLQVNRASPLVAWVTTTWDPNCHILCTSSRTWEDAFDVTPRHLQLGGKRERFCPVPGTSGFAPWPPRTRALRVRGKDFQCVVCVCVCVCMKPCELTFVKCFLILFLT